MSKLSAHDLQRIHHRATVDSAASFAQHLVGSVLGPRTARSCAMKDCRQPQNEGGGAPLVEAGLSKKAQKKLAKKQRKAAVKSELQKQSQNAENSYQRCGLTGPGAGKAGRAREARLGIVTERRGPSGHRARGGAPVAISPEHAEIVALLEGIETKARLRFHPSLEKRAPVPMDCHGSMEAPHATDGVESHPNTTQEGACSLRDHDLRPSS